MLSIPLPRNQYFFVAGEGLEGLTYNTGLGGGSGGTWWDKIDTSSAQKETIFTYIFELPQCFCPSNGILVPKIPVKTSYTSQRAKKVVSDSPRQVNFAIGLVIFVLNLPNGQVVFLVKIQITEGL